MKFKYIGQVLTIPEILEKCGQEETVEDKLKILQIYDSRNLQWFVYTLYNWDWTKFTIPQHTPSKHPIGASFLTWNNAIARINNAYKLVDVNPKKAESQLIVALEQVSAPEYQLFMMMLQNKKQIEGVHKSVFKKMYPQFFRSEAENPSN